MGHIGAYNQERHLAHDDVIVSKTDLKGRITYANQTFQQISGYLESELLGEPHNIIRHPDMPRGVFSLLWDTISTGTEVFAYVKNRCKDGGFYWVLAHVTPTFDDDGRIIGYHSNRRAPEPSVVRAVEQLYQQMLAEEARHSNPKAAARAGKDWLEEQLTKLGLAYDEWFFSLYKGDF